MKIKNIFFLFILLTVGFDAIGQNEYQKAEKKFEAKEYYPAVELYKDAYARGGKSKKAECVWKIAECYRLLGDFKQAKTYYGQAVHLKCKEMQLASSYLADSTKLYQSIKQESDTTDDMVSPELRYSNGGKVYTGEKYFLVAESKYQYKMALHLISSNLNFDDIDSGFVMVRDFEIDFIFKLKVGDVVKYTRIISSKKFEKDREGYKLYSSGNRLEHFSVLLKKQVLYFSSGYMTSASTVETYAIKYIKLTE